MVAAYQSGFSVGGAEAAGAVGADELKGGDVAGEGAGVLVVFAVDVVGDGTAEGDVFGAGGDGEEEAARDGEVEDLGEGDAGLGGEEAGLRVEGDEAVHAGGLEEIAAFEEADVAVAAAHADGEGAVGEVGGDAGEVRLPGEGDEGGLVLGVAAPGFEGRGSFGFAGGLRHRF